MQYDKNWDKSMQTSMSELSAILNYVFKPITVKIITCSKQTNTNTDTTTTTTDAVVSAV